ncbi:hypothetical protein PIB30_073396 [Stylosanthes scabra]|uniref:Uncharacterized protein n=1 Tax=Stylosanthes scabra TaxID=79078 RepID=A0ABU6RPA0_9FABA|nr:hypothetical protein [Stylosanthes scabra]
MGRAPCCDKANVKKGPWSPEEDAKLKSYIEQHGTGGNWIALPQKIGLKRCGKSCRLRWLNYLRPNLKHGGFSEEEDNIICSLYVSIGSRWSVIAAQLPGRTDNDIKNYWNTRLKKKLLGNNRNRRNKEQQQFQPCSNNNQEETTSINRGRSSPSVIFGHDDSLLVHENNSTIQQQQQCYWPHFMPVLPIPNVPYSTSNNHFLLGSSFNDQDSIKKLLIKLGGRFYNNGVDYHNYHPTLDDGLNHLLHQSQGQGQGIITTTHSNNNNSTQQEVVYHQEQVQFGDGNNGGLHDELVQRQGNFNIEIEEEMVGTNTNNNFIPQRLLLNNNGLEFLCGDMAFSDKIILGSTNRVNWGESSNSGNSVIYQQPLLASSNYQQDQGVRPSEECALQEYSTTIATMRSNNSNTMLHV